MTYEPSVGPSVMANNGVELSVTFYKACYYRANTLLARSYNYLFVIFGSFANTGIGLISGSSNLGFGLERLSILT